MDQGSDKEYTRCTNCMGIVVKSSTKEGTNGRICADQLECGDRKAKYYKNKYSFRVVDTLVIRG